jgi:VanZ family protein
LQKNQLAKYKAFINSGLTWFAICTLLLTLPGSAFSQESWLDKIGFDKWVHIGLFAVLVFLICWGLLKFTNNEKKLKRLFIVFTLDCLVFGIIMEFVQDNFIPNRSFDYGDILADAIGCFAGWWFINKTYKGYIKK